MKTLLSAQDLGISFGHKKLLTGINLEINAGELIQLSGPNGCGKTSLLETLIGLRKSKQVSRNFSEAEYGYLPQISKVFPKISLSLGEVSQHTSPFYPEELLSRHWSVASGGEKMKSLIAKSLSEAQSILFLDEPFNHLDLASAGALTQMIKEKVESGLTVVFIGHHDIDLNPRTIEVSQWSC